MGKRKVSPLFKAVIRVLRWVYPKVKIYGEENITAEPCIIVGNHTQIHGPVCCELYLDDNCFTWCAAEMTKFKEVPAYSFKDFWSQKPKWTRIIYKPLSYLIAPFSVFLFNNARTIPVYHDMRIIGTFKKTVKVLANGGNVVIFPEFDEKFNNIVYNFKENFVDTAKLYFKKTGKEVLFVPMYVAPNLKGVYFGKGVRFSAEAGIDEERTRICHVLKESITEIARNLPEHTVVPYRNIPKRDYPKNTDVEVAKDEKTGC